MPSVGKYCLARLATFCVVLMPTVARAAVATAPAATQPVAALPDPAELPVEVETDTLAITLRPLTTDRLAEVAEVWLARLREKQADVSATELALRQAADAEASRLQNQLAQLRNERNALAERVETVLVAWRRKGGDPAEAQQYVDAVTGVSLEDVDNIWLEARAWLTDWQGGLAVAMNILWFFVILVLAFIVAKIFARLTARGLRRVGRASQLLKEFLAGLVSKVVMVIGLIVAISFLGVNIGPLVAAIGAAGLVVGLALQGTLSNFASGILILMYRPYDVGDVISAAGVSGKVQAMTLVSTTIVTFDNQRILVPNNNIWGDVITNVTGQITRRVDMTFGIGYGDDIDRAADIFRDIVTAHPLVLKDPEPMIRVHQLGDSSVNFIVRPWVNTADYWTVYWDVTAEVKRRLDKEGVTIPFPQRDVHLYHENRA